MIFSSLDRLSHRPSARSGCVSNHSIPTSSLAPTPAAARGFFRRQRVEDRCLPAAPPAAAALGKFASPSVAPTRQTRQRSRLPLPRVRRAASPRRSSTRARLSSRAPFAARRQRRLDRSPGEIRRVVERGALVTPSVDDVPARARGRHRVRTSASASESDDGAQPRAKMASRRDGIVADARETRARTRARVSRRRRLARATRGRASGDDGGRDGFRDRRVRDKAIFFWSRAARAVLKLGDRARARSSSLILSHRRTRVRPRRACGVGSTEARRLAPESHTAARVGGGGDATDDQDPQIGIIRAPRGWISRRRWRRRG